MSLWANDALHDQWDQLLQQHVHHGLVDYSGLYKDQDKLDAYLHLLATTSTTGMQREELLALYINAYNSCTVRLILDNSDGKHFPQSIKDTGSLFSSPWSKKICTIDGSKLSLDTIEHDILRPQFQDNRIHFAVNCASMSCPTLLDRAYLPSQVDDQLKLVTKRFLADEKANYLRDNVLYVSKIFKWYGEDFPDGVAEFFLQYGSEKIISQLEHPKTIEIDYLPYDWSLNQYDK